MIKKNLPVTGNLKYRHKTLSPMWSHILVLNLDKQ